MSNTIPVTFGSDYDFDSVVAKIQFADNISGRAKLAYNLLKDHPGMVSFTANYTMDENGESKITTISISIVQPQSRLKKNTDTEKVL